MFLIFIIAAYQITQGDREGCPKGNNEQRKVH